MPARRSGWLRRRMEAAVSAGVAVPAFNVPYLPIVEAICRALREHGAFGMVAVARLEVTKFEARSLAAVAAEYRRWADPETVTLHLDHVPVIDEDDLRVDWEPLIDEALALGYDSVMIDGSRLPLEQNIAATARVVERAHAAGALVEAELGAVMGHEAGPMPPYEELFASKRGFTSPEDAARFVRETGVDWLSVSVGSYHGAIAPETKDRAKVPARLDVERIRELQAATRVPLVLHGGSGVIQSYVDEAVRSGMVKINIATDIRQPYERVLAGGGTVADAQEAAYQAMGRLIGDVYRIEGSAARLADIRGAQP